MKRAGKIIKFLIHILRENFQKKLKFTYFYSLRKRYKNWLSLYLLQSSFLLDVLEIIKRELKIAFLYRYWDKITFKTIYSNGTVLYHPISTRSLSIILGSQYENYMNSFKQLYSEPIKFNKDDVVIDIGAHIGSFSIPMARRHEVKVFAYEPDPSNVNCILKGVSKNKIEKDSFIVKPYAVWKDNGFINFSLGDTPTTGSVSQSGFFLRKAKNMTIRVKTVSLQTIFDKNNIYKCKILKIDCEGSEYAIFSKMQQDIFNRIEYLFIEIHPTDEHKAEELLNILQKYFVVKYHKTKSMKGGLYNEMYEAFCKRR